MRALLSFLLMVAVVMAIAGQAVAEESDLFVRSSHYGFSGVITKIESGMLLVKTDTSLQPRVISPTKAERVGLYNAKIGEAVNMLVDSGNVLMDFTAYQWCVSSPGHLPLCRRFS